jgi:hypothetical protein
MSAFSLMQIAIDDFGGLQSLAHRLISIPRDSMNQILRMEGDLFDLIFIYFGSEYKIDKDISERELRM